MAQWQKQDGGARHRDATFYPQLNGAPNPRRKMSLPLGCNRTRNRPRRTPPRSPQDKLILRPRNATSGRQLGAGLAEALLATALLAIITLGLLEYRQRLAVFKRRLQDVTLALSLSHQCLELMRQSATAGALARPRG
ncbi:hypothetical protein D8L93_10940 [Sodalis-like symbiont of Bactericera trigonica]|nr:hypothetical protein D8L93_10940 [Sodalis-like symbiont of Bactericera trigonica]